MKKCSCVAADELAPQLAQQVAFPAADGIISECGKCQALLQPFLAMVLLIKRNHSPRALHLACTKGRRTFLSVGSGDNSDSSDVQGPFLSLSHRCPRGRGQGGAAACHKCHWYQEGIWRGQQVDKNRRATTADYKCSCSSAGMDLFCL